MLLSPSLPAMLFADEISLAGREAAKKYLPTATKYEIQCCLILTDAGALHQVGESPHRIQSQSRHKLGTRTNRPTALKTRESALLSTTAGSKGISFAPRCQHGKVVRYFS